MTVIRRLSLSFEDCLVLNIYIHLTLPFLVLYRIYTEISFQWSERKDKERCIHLPLISHPSSIQILPQILHLILLLIHLQTFTLHFINKLNHIHPVDQAQINLIHSIPINLIHQPLQDLTIINMVSILNSSHYHLTPCTSSCQALLKVVLPKPTRTVQHSPNPLSSAIRRESRLPIRSNS